jgi:hypothetical protein
MRIHWCALALLLAACSSTTTLQSTNGDAVNGDDCAASAAPTNAPQCPSWYVGGHVPTDSADAGPSSADGGCAPIGLYCEYPHAGDGIGCQASTAVYACVPEGYPTVTDAGPNAPGHWIFAQ